MKSQTHLHQSFGALLLLLLSAAVFAGAGGTEFTQVYDQISGWASGMLGKTLAVAALIVGLGIGVVRQSVMAAALGVAMALVAGFGPAVIDGIITSALPITTEI